MAQRIAAAATLRGKFRLRSGQVSDVYFDKYRLESDPILFRAIVLAMKSMVPQGVDGLAGLELGGVPLAVMLSQELQVPAYFVRKKAKEYGTCRLAEGGEVGRRHLVILEDVVTTAGQVVASTEELRKLGAIVTHALCVIDRDQGGSARASAAGLELRSLFRVNEMES